MVIQKLKGLGFHKRSYIAEAGPLLSDARFHCLDAGQPREARLPPMWQFENFWSAISVRINCSVDHEEFVEIVIENRHRFRLVSPMKLGQRMVSQSPRLSENQRPPGACVLSLNEFRNFGLAVRNLMRGTDFLEPLNLVYRFIFIA
jgi:hypothetical protein